jgi:hypothetical protein
MMKPGSTKLIATMIAAMVLNTVYEATTTTGAIHLHYLGKVGPVPPVPLTRSKVMQRDP